MSIPKVRPQDINISNGHWTLTEVDGWVRIYYKGVQQIGVDHFGIIHLIKLIYMYLGVFDAKERGTEELRIKEKKNRLWKALKRIFRKVKKAL